MLVNGEAAEQPGLIKDTTTQGFREDVIAESMKQPAGKIRIVPLEE